MHWQHKIWIGILLLSSPLLALEGWIEGGVGYFRPDSKTLREIFNSAWLDSRAEAGVFVWKDLALFGQFDYLSQRGLSLGGGERVEFTLIPLTLGLKWIHSVAGQVDLYPALALRYNLGWEKTSYPFIRRHIFHQAVGGFAAVGALFHLTSHLLFDLNFGYSFAQFGAPSTPSGVEGKSLWIGGISLLAEFEWKF